jgi:crotonobetaine/carnitine-CoA ligase
MPLESFEARRDGWFHTGDVLRRDAHGMYYLVVRLKDMMRRRGENISSFEVESAVLSHPAVRYAAAYGVPSDSGSEDEVMVAVELQPDAALDPAELFEYLKPKMPSFAVPRYIEVRAEMPMTLTERIRKFELRKAGVSAATWDALESGKRS